jgi:uncharacterized protein (DUF4415 family)
VAEMSEENMKRASLADIRKMKDRGELYHNPDASVGPPAGEEIPADFWDKAIVVSPKKRSVHLKLDPEVFEFFVAETDGKGHLTRMQDVLKSYMRAKTQKAS